jgi:RNA polymerase sigma factor (sigma-70 family)
MTVHGTESSAGRLFAAARGGDGGAWTELIDRYTGHLTKIAASYRTGDDVQDIVQTTWMRLIEEGGGIRNPDAVLGWLRTTLRRECLRTLKRRRAEYPTDIRIADWADRVDPPVEDVVTERLLRAESRRRVARAMRTLPVPRRRLLHRLAGHAPVSYREVADELSMPVGSIGPTRARAIGQLRRALTRHTPEE